MIEDNGFGLRIIEKNEQKCVLDQNSHKHANINYLEVINNRDTLCDALVEFEGNRIGMWRIHTRESIVIDYSVGIKDSFIFFLEKRWDKSGMIKVIFYPKKKESPITYEIDKYDYEVTLPIDQSYRDVRSIAPLLPNEIDWSQVTELIFRL